MRSGAAIPRSKFQIKVWHIAIVVVCLLVVAVWHGTNVVKDSYTVRPENIYKETFTDPRVHITDLTGGGSKSGYFDVWLHFKCPTNDMHLKDADQYTKLPAVTDAVRWFEEKRPDHTDTSDQPALEGDINKLELFYTTRRTAVNVNNIWVLHNEKTTDYWYRNWGY